MGNPDRPNFKTPTEGLRGKRVLLGEAQLVPHPPWLEKHAESVQEKRVEGVPITAEAVLEVVNWETVPIDSVWDLPMVGSERLAVERRIRHCTGGHPPRLRPGYLADRPLVYRVEVFEYGAVIPSRVYNGAFVNREDGTWCRLHRWKKVPAGGIGVFSQYGQAAIDGTVPQWVVNEAVRVRGSKSAISEGDMKPTVVWVLQCMPVFELPEDADLVVRTAVLEELARRMLTLPDEKRPTPTATEPPEMHPEQTEPASEIERAQEPAGDLVPRDVAGHDLGSDSQTRSPDFRWENVTIRFTSELQVQIMVGNTLLPAQGHEELGFAYKRSKLPNRAWMMLQHLAQNDGIPDLPSGQWSPKRIKSRKVIQELRKILRALVKTDADPVPFKKGIGYKTAFKLDPGSVFD